MKTGIKTILNFEFIVFQVCIISTLNQFTILRCHRKWFILNYACYMFENGSSLILTEKSRVAQWGAHSMPEIV